MSVPLRFLLPAVFVAAWWIGSATGAISERVIAGPPAVWTAFTELLGSGQLIDFATASFVRAALGVGIGVSAGLLLGLVSGLSALAEVQLDGKANQWPATLSGGEAQRAALARALVRDPELLLLDEPFAALDALTRLRMQDLVGELVARHRPAVLMVTHDVDEAVRLADRVIVLDRGRFAVDTTIAVPRPRERTDPDILRYHTDFLAHLGVGDPARRLLRSTP